MLKNKIKFFSALILSVILLFSAIAIISKPVIADDGADIIIEDDFTAVSNIEGANKLDMMNVYDYSGVSKAEVFVDAGFGLIPAEYYSAMPRTGDGYIVYKIQADEGYLLNDMTIDISAYVTHCDAGQFIGKEKTNIKAFVATDRSGYVEVYSYCPTGGGGDYQGYQGSGTKRLEKSRKDTIDITNHIVGARTVYVKIELYHLTFEEIVASNINSINSFVDVDNGLVKRVGVSLHKVSIKGKQSAEGTVITPVGFTDNYAANGIKIQNSTNIVEYENLLNFPDWHGALPTTESTWKDPLLTDDAYAVYKLTASQGSTLKDVKVTLGLGLATSGGFYNWWSGSWDNANVYIDVSTNGGVTYTEVYDVLSDTSLYPKDTSGNFIPDASFNNEKYVNCFKASMYVDGVYDSSRIYDCFNNVTPTVSLDGYGGSELYIRIRIKHPQPLELHSSLVNGTNMGRIGIQYHGISVSANQETPPVVEEKNDNLGTFVIEDNLQNLTQGVTEWKEQRSVSGLSTYNYGSNDHGAVPSSTWGASVNADNGYAIYKIPINGNGINTSLNSLILDLKYILNGAYHDGDVVVSTSFNGEDYAEIYRATDDGALPTSATENLKSVDLTQTVTAESAKNAKDLFVKITIEHEQAESVLIQRLAVKLLKVKFTGKRNFVMENGASVRLGQGDTGLRFTTLVDKSMYNTLIHDGYKVSFAMVIMPKDYLLSYGDINEDNLFGTEAKYCWIADESGKVKVLHKASLLNENYNDDYYSYSYSIGNILSANINREFVARGYLKCEKDGMSKYIFAEYANDEINNNCRSVTAVAQKAFADSSSKTDKTNIRAKYIKDVKSYTVSYKVKHIYISNNDISDIVTESFQAEAGTVVSANELTKSGYIAVKSVSTESKEYVSLVTSTIWADGSTELIRYYIKQA